MRPHNIILIPVCVTASKILRKLCSSVKCLTLMHIWLAMVLFHSQVRYIHSFRYNLQFQTTIFIMELFKKHFEVFCIDQVLI